MAANALDPLQDIRRHGQQQTDTYLAETRDSSTLSEDNPDAWLDEEHEAEINSRASETEYADLLTGVVFPDRTPFIDDQENPPSLSL